MLYFYVYFYMCLSKYNICMRATCICTRDIKDIWIVVERREEELIRIHCALNNILAQTIRKPLVAAMCTEPLVITRPNGISVLPFSRHKARLEV